jgi:hypothetical protein
MLWLFYDLSHAPDVVWVCAAAAADKVENNFKKEACNSI